MIRLQDGPIQPEELIDAVRRDGAGAVEIFLGTVRDSNAGKKVLYLEYHAYEPMAIREMERIGQEAAERYDLHRTAIIHRTGSLKIGEISVVVAVSSAHRVAAREACAFIIDTLKEKVPIWKKEHFEGGTVWIEGQERSETN